MKTRWLGTIVALTVAALAVAAAPAFTADNGTITVAITAQEEAAPCLAVTPDSIDFGTLPFSTPGSGGSTGSATVDVHNCGQAVQILKVSGTNPSGPSGTWTLSDELGNLCDNAPLDTTHLSASFEGYANPIANSDRPILNSKGEDVRFSPGSTKAGDLEVHMPCRGSNGGGEQKALTLTFTAVVA